MRQVGQTAVGAQQESPQSPPVKPNMVILLSSESGSLGSRRPRKAFWIWEDGTGRWSITTELEEDPHPYNGTLVFSLFPNRGAMSSSPRWIPPPRALIQAEAQDCQQGVWSS